MGMDEEKLEWMGENGRYSRQMGMGKWRGALNDVCKCVFVCLFECVCMCVFVLSNTRKQEPKK